MIDLYTWPTPNGRKVSILLEELRIKYTVFPINIGKGDQLSDEFRKISFNHKIPVIYDHENQRSITESGTILIYLAEKFGNFLRTDEYRWGTLQWLMWQMSSIGPIFGQAHHFLYYNPGRSTYSEERFKNEVKKLYNLLNQRLENFDYVSGPEKGEYSIADIALWPWISRFQRHGIDLNDYPGVYRWYKTIYARPAVQKGYNVPHFEAEIPT